MLGGFICICLFASEKNKPNRKIHTNTHVSCVLGRTPHTLTKNIKCLKRDLVFFSVFTVYTQCTRHAVHMKKIPQIIYILALLSC